MYWRPALGSPEPSAAGTISGTRSLRGRLAWAGVADAKVEGAVERLLAEPEST
jgi:hypothetical protein